jgi:phosphoribosylformylglycinamidine cyclo-ligase
MVNCGVGMVVVVPKDTFQATIDHLNFSGEKAWLIGKVIKSNGKQVLI